MAEAQRLHPAYQSLTEFKRRVYRRYIHAPHLEIIDQALMQVTRYVETGGREGIQFLIIEVPPRHGKSLTVSQYYPAWHIGRNPEHRVIDVSYAQHLSEKFSRRARNTIPSSVYQEVFPNVRPAADHFAASSWDIAETEGGMDAVGILSGATGKGGQIVSADDLIGSRADAESKTKRDKVWDNFVGDILSRLEPSGAVILTGTRQHLDDPTGRIVERWDPASYVRINLKALIESEQDAAEDLLGRKIDEALFPDRYPTPVLKQIRTRVGPYIWSSLYQQNPTPAEGGVFKRRWFDPVVTDTPNIQRMVRFWDLAMSSKTSADYTVGTLIGEGEDGREYVLDVQRVQLEWGDVVPFMARVILGDGPNVAQGIEEKGFMSRAIQALNADPRLRGYQVWGYPKDTDKLTAALPFAARAAAGMVSLVAGGWNAAWLDEVCSFTGSGDETDDQVDSAAGASAMLAEGTGANYGSVVHENDSIIGGW